MKKPGQTSMTQKETSKFHSDIPLLKINKDHLYLNDGLFVFNEIILPVLKK